MLEYKGYIGKVEYDNEAEIFHGEVVDTRDVITFQGDSVKSLQKAFVDSVEDYLEFCKVQGKTPDKPFSGQFVTRVSPELHRRVNVAAAVAGMSLNAWIAAQLQSAVSTLGLPEKDSSQKGAQRAVAAKGIVIKNKPKQKRSRKADQHA